MNTELLILFISFGFLIGGIILWLKGNDLLTNGKIADAVIFKNNFQPNRSGGIYYPVVRFLTDKQVWITQELSIGYSPAKAEGTKLEVIYDPEDPSKVEINSSFQLEVLPRIFVAFGIFGIIFGIFELLNVTELIPN